MIFKPSNQDDCIKSVRDYFSGDAIFEVPCYQRGYKWSILKHREGKTHLEKLFADLKDAYKVTNEYHLQGVTVRKYTSNGEERDELVDGQQRTTSLFLLLIWAKCKGIPVKSIDTLIKTVNKGQLRLIYGVRENANNWIDKRYRGESPAPNPEEQDICAFDKAWNTIDNELAQLSNEDKLVFINFVLDRVKLIYVELVTEQPTRVFSMMNREKAEMTRTDLVKAKLLSEASREAMAEDSLSSELSINRDEQNENEWQINHLRSHFAREWDAWRKWWEDENHSSFLTGALRNFEGEPALSRLLRLYWIRKVQHPEFINKYQSKVEELVSDNKDFLFSTYNVFIQDGNNSGRLSKGAVETFEELRHLQHILQEWFESPDIYNWLGLLFHGTGCPKLKCLLFLLNQYETNKVGFCDNILKKLYRAASLFTTTASDENTPERLLEKLTNDKERQSTIDGLYKLFEKEDVYNNYYEVAAQQLLRCNVQCLIPFDLKFDFTMYEQPEDKKKRSLEHIYPKSKFKDALEGTKSDKTIDNLKGNNIGNLVLLPKGLNSQLQAKEFHEKREMVNNALLGQAQGQEKANMALWLHSLKVFISSCQWEAADITMNRDAFLSNMEYFYKCDGRQL